MMPKLKIGRYSGDPNYDGYVEPADRQWILFIRRDGTPELHTNRDPKTGVLRVAPPPPQKDTGTG